jgi:hypothetical protein
MAGDPHTGGSPQHKLQRGIGTVEEAAGDVRQKHFNRFFFN